jgi:hypothetical protein
MEPEQQLGSFEKASAFGAQAVQRRISTGGHTP